MKPEEIAEIVPEELCGFLLTDPAMARAWMKEEITGLLDSENQSAWLTMADLLCGEEVSVHVPDAGNEEPAEQSPDADEESSEIFDEPIFLDQKTNNELVPYTPPVQKSLWARIFGL